MQGAYDHTQPAQDCMQAVYARMLPAYDRTQVAYDLTQRMLHNFCI